MSAGLLPRKVKVLFYFKYPKVPGSVFIQRTSFIHNIVLSFPGVILFVEGMRFRVFEPEGYGALASAIRIDGRLASSSSGVLCDN